MIRTLGRIGFVLAWVFALKTLLMGVAHSQPYTSTAPGIYVQEEDGNPSARFRRIKVPNSKLTNNSDGSCSLSFNDAVYDCTSVNACTIDAESMEGVDWGTMTDTKYCVYDLAGTEVDCNASAPAVEGTAVLSTGEEGGTKFLREDGDGTSSWQTPAGGGDLLADGTVPLTADWDVGLFDITAVEFKGALKGLADTATALAANPAAATAGSCITNIAANGDVEAEVDVWTESENTAAGYTSTTDQVGAVTLNKWCIGDGTLVQCTEEAPAGAGDITAVGSCADGSCGTAGGNDIFPFIYEGTANEFETTFAVTDPTTPDKTITFPDLTGTVALSTNKLSLFAATTSAELAGVLSDEDGTGDCGANLFCLGGHTHSTYAPLDSPTFTTKMTLNYATASELVATNASKELVSLAVATYPSLTELSYVKGLSSAIQTQLGNKAPSATPTFTTSITTDYLTASEIVISDGDKKIVSAPVATYPSLTELSYVKGLSSAVQTQLTAKGAHAGQVWTGTHDFGGAVLEIPNGATVTDPAVAGQVAIDTTSDQFLYYGGAQRVLTYRYTTCRTLETPVDADDNIPVWAFPQAITITDVHCWTEGGTSIAVTISDGTNALEAVTCDADGADDDGSIANGTFTANENIEWDFAAPTGTVDWVKVCITYTITAD